MRRDPFILQAGQLIDRYQLLLPVATGGTSRIWAARLHGSRGFEKLVGLKTLAVAASENRELERLLWREGRLASQIQHPNVVQYFDLIEHQGVVYLAMEWIDGEPLSSLLRAASGAGAIPLGIAVQILVQACKGLRAAHELCGADGRSLGLAHCDVSPQNLMIDVHGTVRLMDFGIAKVRRLSADNDDRIRGKPSFMAPEQALGQPVDLRADIFALGIIAYLLTTGRHPFHAASSADTLRAICGDVPVTPPGAIVENYPRALQRVVLRALARRPEQRFQSATEMLNELVAAFPGYASESELSVLLQRVCGSSLMSRRGLLNEALQRHSSPNFVATGEEHASLLEPTSDTLSPSHLAADPAFRAAISGRWRSMRITFAAGVLAFVAAFGWTLARTAAQVSTHPVPAARAEPVPAPQPLAADTSRVEETAQEGAPPSADSTNQADPTKVLPALAPAAPTPPVSGSKLISATATRKPKPIPVRQRYGI